jgi:hypothetical protein
MRHEALRGISVPLFCKYSCCFEVIKQQHYQSDDREHRATKGRASHLRLGQSRSGSCDDSDS